MEIMQSDEPWCQDRPASCLISWIWNNIAAIHAVRNDFHKAMFFQGSSALQAHSSSHARQETSSLSGPVVAPPPGASGEFLSCKWWMSLKGGQTSPPRRKWAWSDNLPKVPTRSTWCLRDQCNQPRDRPTSLNTLPEGRSERAQGTRFETPKRPVRLSTKRNLSCLFVFILQTPSTLFICNSAFCSMLLFSSSNGFALRCQSPNTKFKFDGESFYVSQKSCLLHGSILKNGKESTSQRYQPSNLCIFVFNPLAAASASKRHCSNQRSAVLQRPGETSWRGRIHPVSGLRGPHPWATMIRWRRDLDIYSLPIHSWFYSSSATYMHVRDSQDLSFLSTHLFF